MKDQSEATSDFGIPEFATGSDRTGASSGGLDIIDIAWRYRRRMALSLLAGFGLGLIAYWQAGPLYQVNTKILVSKKAAMPLQDVETAMTYGERGEHVALIMSPMIVGSAVRNHQLDQLPSLQRSDDPTDEIVGELRVKRSAGQDQSFLNVLDIFYRHSNPPEGRRIVAAVVNAYQAYLEETHEEQTAKMVQLLTQADHNLHSQLKEKEREYLVFREQAPLSWTGPPGADRSTESATNVHQRRLQAIETQRRELLLKRAEINSKLKVLEEAVRRGESQQSLQLLVRQFLLEASRSAPAELTNTNRPDGPESQLLPLLLEEQRLLRDFGADHPDVRTVRSSIETITMFYRRQGIPVPAIPELSQDGTDAETDNSALDPVAVYINSLRQKLAEFDFREAELARLEEQETRLAQNLVQYQLQDQTLNDEIKRHKTLWNVAVSRLNEVNLIKDNQGYLLQQIAPIQEELVIKRCLMFLGGGGCAGIALMLGLVCLREQRQSTVRSLDEITYRLGIPVFGAIPQLPLESDHSTTDEGIAAWKTRLWYVTRPESIEAEALRSMRTALLATVGEARVLQITSPEPQDGKTTLAANLAAAFAHAGKKILLIDADLRNPDVHRLFGTRHDIGLVDVLAGEIELDDALQATKIRGLSLLTAGRSTGSPAELLASSRFSSMLRAAKERFDFVLLDSSALLDVSDPCIVTAQTDGVLLVLRTSKTRRTAVDRAKELLETHGVQVLGVLANGMELSSNFRQSGNRQDKIYVSQRTPAIASPQPVNCG